MKRERMLSTTHRLTHSKPEMSSFAWVLTNYIKNYLDKQSDVMCRPLPPFFWASMNEEKNHKPLIAPNVLCKCIYLICFLNKMLWKLIVLSTSIVDQGTPSANWATEAVIRSCYCVFWCLVQRGKLPNTPKGFSFYYETYCLTLY